MSDPALSVRQRQFLHRIRTTTNAVLHYNHVTDDLAIWYWCVFHVHHRIYNLYVAGLQMTWGNA